MAKKKTTKTSSTSAPADIGLIGLAVMGQNLALNMADHGFKVAVYNRTTEKMLDFVREVDAKEPSKDNIIGVADFKQFVKSIKRPRRIVIMVQAGRGTDAVIDQLTKVCDKGDIIIDGGNANWNDTIRREKELTDKGFEFIGTGCQRRRGRRAVRALNHARRIDRRRGNTCNRSGRRSAPRSTRRPVASCSAPSPASRSRAANRARP
jgi:hypothetical protein